MVQVGKNKINNNNEMRINKNNLNITLEYNIRSRFKT
jgi:hypothetical protein